MKNEYKGIIASLSFLIIFVFNPFGVNLFALPKISFLGVFIGIILLGVALHLFINKKIIIYYNNFVYIFLVLWLLSLILSTIFSIAPLTSFWGTYDRMNGLYSHILYIILFFIFLHFLITKKAQNTFLKSILVMSVITGFHAIFQNFNFDFFTSYNLDSFLGRSFSTFGQPNFLGQFLLFPTWISVYFLIKQKKIKKTIFPFLSLVIIILALFLTKNRASLFGLIIGTVFFFAFYPTIKLKIKIYFTGLIVFFFGLFITIFAPSLRSLYSRFYLWESGVEVIKESPLIGWGLETFRFTYQKAPNIKLFEFEQLFTIPDRVHNIFLDIGVQQGFLGILIYFSILISLFILFFKNYKKRDNLMLCFFSALISILISELLGFPMSPHYIVFIALISIILINYLKFKSFKIQNRILLPIFSIFLILFSLFTITHSYKIIFADILLKKSEVYLFQNNFSKSINSLEKAVMLNPKQDKIYYRYSEFLSAIKLEEYEILNKEILKKAGNFDGKSFIYYLFKGDFYVKLEEFDKANTHFKQGHLLAPTNPLILREWGKMYYQQKNYVKTIKKLEMFLDLLPGIWEYKPYLEKLSFEKQERYRLFRKHAPELDLVFEYLLKSHKQLKNLEKVNYYKKFI